MSQEKIESTGGIEDTIKATPEAVQQLVSDAARAQELIGLDELEAGVMTNPKPEVQ